jgi:hypothetical protein
MNNRITRWALTLGTLMLAATLLPGQISQAAALSSTSPPTPSTRAVSASIPGAAYADNGRYFPQTGKSVGGKFLDYWNSHGGLAQQGFPISEEFTEVNDLDHKPYKVQYFERAVFEWHPENEPPYDILLSQLGTFRYKAKYPGGTGASSVFSLFSSIMGTAAR